MPAEKLQTKGSLFRRVEQSNEQGHSLVDEWVADAWAEVKPVTGNEEWQGSSVSPNTTHEVTIRGTSQPVEQGWFFGFKDRFGTKRTLEIGSVIDISHLRNRMLLLRCIEVTSG